MGSTYSSILNVLPSSVADLRVIDPVSFVSQAWFAGKPTWGTEEIPDLSGRVAIVTGGNAGIGKETVKALLRQNAKVYMACRSPEKARAAIDELKEITGKEAILLRLDLSDLHSVQAAQEEFTRKENHIHMLFNNGGVMFTPMEMESAGYDLQIYTNVLGPFHLTKLLLPTLLRTAEEDLSWKPRVVNLTSSAHYFAKANALNFDSFIVGPVRQRFTPDRMYIQSKFANIVFANELARRYGDHGIVSTSVNPGNLQTDLGRHVTSLAEKFALTLLQIYPPSWGALTQLWAGTSPEGADLNGKYLMPWSRVGSARAETQDLQLGNDLWTWLEEQVLLVTSSPGS